MVTTRAKQPAVPAELRAAVGDVALTPRQWECLAAFHRLTEQADGVSPTMREVAAELGISKVSVFEHLKQLERKGVIYRERHCDRSIRIVYAADRERSQVGELRVRYSALERAIRTAARRLKDVSLGTTDRRVAAVATSVATDLESAVAVKGMTA
jgi:DNA-binding MarR family transcriptional regulator